MGVDYCPVKEERHGQGFSVHEIYRILILTIFLHFCVWIPIFILFFRFLGLSLGSENCNLKVLGPVEGVLRVFWELFLALVGVVVGEATWVDSRCGCWLDFSSSLFSEVSWAFLDLASNSRNVLELKILELPLSVQFGAGGSLLFVSVGCTSDQLVSRGASSELLCDGSIVVVPADSFFRLFPTSLGALKGW